MKKIRANLTYANVMSTIAVLLVLGGGTALAATVVLPKNSVGAKQLKKGAVTPAKLAPAAKAALTGPRGATGAVGPQGPKGDAGTTGEKGEPGTFLSALPSGRTLTGVYGISGHIQNPGDTGAEDAISFQIPLSEPPVESVVIGGAPTTECPGTVNDPAAAPGYLCLYEQAAYGDEPALKAEPTGSGKDGFAVFIPGATVEGPYNDYGTWAVTAR
ncbi:MAG TPA: hypothetical protein VJ204_03600 [Solirubrobacterales bacterium]|nr:hypothetical protein [Solirubrobacterales bacterium]